MSARGKVNNVNDHGNKKSDDNNDDKQPVSAIVTAKAKARGLDLLAYSQRQIDRVVSPATRQKAIDSTTSFASKRPMLSLFVAVQLLLSLLPLLLFGTFVLSTLVLATLAAASFVLFWTGLALLFLAPTLCFTAGLAILIWLWAACTYVIFRALYSRLPASVRAHSGGEGSDRHVIFSASGQGFDFDGAVSAEANDMRE